MMVDEYQDTNHAQYVLIKLLATEEGNLLVVGDDYQSIYGFRGRYQEHPRFRTGFPAGKDYKVEQNYRSTGSVLAPPTASWPTTATKPNPLDGPGEGDKVKVYRALDERDEAALWPGRSAVLRPRVICGGTFILYRTNAQSRVLEEVFRHWGIPYKLVGTLGFERKEIKDLVAYLRLLVNPNDGISYAGSSTSPKGASGRPPSRIEAYAGPGSCPCWRFWPWPRRYPD